MTQDRRNLSPLRRAWTEIIQANDYDDHMAAVGQAQANARLVLRFLAENSFAPDSRIIFVGAGTGQMLDFIPADALLGFSTVFTDINVNYLAVLRSRLQQSGKTPARFGIIVDDLENSSIRSEFAAVIAVLVLEHLDWRKAIASMGKLGQRMFVIVQENPPGLSTTMTRGRATFGSMAVFESLDSERIDPEALGKEFASHELALSGKYAEEVLDGKKMVGYQFEPSSSVRSDR